MRTMSAQALDSKILALVVVVLIINTVMVGIVFSLTAFPSEEGSDIERKKEMAQDLVEYNQRLAEELDVLGHVSVREVLANFSFEISAASSTTELSKVIVTHARAVQETILREWDKKLRDEIISVLNQDQEIKGMEERLRFTLYISEGGEVEVNPAEALPHRVVKRISEVASPQVIQELIIDVEVEEGQAKIAAPYNPLDHIQSLTEELDSLRVSLHEAKVAAGFTELTGKGVVIEIYDAPEGYTDQEIIHDADVRDVVNELFASGAQGVAVGGERLIATSAIRCVGPVIEVNDRKIPTSPVVIEAVGDPDVLASGLEIIRLTLELNRGLQFKVQKVDELTLPAYSSSSSS